MKFHYLGLMAALGLSALGPACQTADPPPPHDPSGAAPAVPTAPAAAPPQAAPPEAAAEGATAAAKALYAQRCTMCHGLDGRGNGPAAATLSPKPRSYADAAWQASVQDAELRQVIVGGGVAVGKSMMMPANADLKNKPEVVDALVKIIRSFKK